MKWIWLAILGIVIMIVGSVAFRVGTAKLNYQSSATIEIDAPADAVFQLVGNLRNWPRWSPFLPANAPNIQIDQTTSPPTMYWADPRGGESQLTLDRIDGAASQIDHTLNSQLFPEMKGTFQLEELSQDKTRLTWEVSGSLPDSFFYRLASSNYGQLMSSQLQQSLERMKAVAEKGDNEEDSPASESTPEKPATEPPADADTPTGTTTK